MQNKFVIDFKFVRKIYTFGQFKKAENKESVIFNRQEVIEFLSPDFDK